MKGFDAQFKDFPDQMLKITYQISEKNDVEAIIDYYADTPNISIPPTTRSLSRVNCSADPGTRSI